MGKVYDGSDGMASMPRMWEQDQTQSASRYRAYQFSTVLPEMQTGNFSECQKGKTICHSHS